MKPPQKVLSYLDKNKMKYTLVEHKTVYTAYDVAQTLKMKLQEIVKTLLVKVDGKLALAVLPASARLDLKKLKVLAKAKKVELPKENVMKTKLSIIPGALTPFGPLYKLPAYLDKNLLKQKAVLVGSGSFEFSLKMSPSVLVKATQPITGAFSAKKK
ncbi:MAG: YbaK/EbsC family protein [Patescibacteria group bacterium]